MKFDKKEGEAQQSLKIIAFANNRNSMQTL